jgi:RNA polymerase sigma factor (TIGR02999 family)
MAAGGSADLGEITRLLGLLEDKSDADRGLVLEQLMPLVYGELKALAKANRYRWQGELAPGTTSLVHEAYARLARQPGSGYENRRQFFSVASKAMRSILIDNARWHSRQKRGGGVQPLPLREEVLVSAERCDELLALDDALNRLDERQPGLADIVEHRCFGGLTVDETAEALEISPSTVKRRWSLARAWLYRELQPASG